jgi:Kef-type K+ transport system membrane component KefB
MLFVQLGVIFAFARLLRRPIQKIGLPIVIGEMLAGFLLGPTLFGKLAPETFSTFFSSGSIYQIGSLATLIITAYCFVIGLEFDLHHLQGRRSSLAITTLASAAVPAAIGFWIAGWLGNSVGLSVAVSFKISVALCFSVTAFPVLIRIVEGNGLAGQPVGIFSIGVSAVLELLTWACLPVILTLTTTGSPHQALTTILWVAGFLVIWLMLVRKALQWWWARIRWDGPASLLLLAAVGFVSAYMSQLLGIHTIIGAFVGGLVVPREVSSKLAKKIKPACLFLLPIFFAATGLKTTLGISSGNEIVILLALAILAYGVKLLGTTLAARATGGLDWNEAATVGHLMCAKGAIGFAILEICTSSGLLELRGFSILSFVVLVNTILSAWGVVLQRIWAGKYDVRRDFVIAGDA